jgi:hypothetical protein
MMIYVDENLALSKMEILGMIRRKKKVNDLYISSGVILFFAKEFDHYYGMVALLSW